MEEHLIFEAVPHETPMGWIIDNIPQCEFTDWVDELNDTGYLKLYLKFNTLWELADFRNAMKNSPFYDYTNFKEEDQEFLKSLAEMIKYISADFNHRCQGESSCLYSPLTPGVESDTTKGCAVGWFLDKEWAKKVDEHYGGLSFDDLLHNISVNKNPKLLTSDQMPIQLVMHEHLFSDLQGWHDFMRSDATEQTNIDMALDFCDQYLRENEFNFLKSVI